MLSLVFLEVDHFVHKVHDCLVPQAIRHINLGHITVLGTIHKLSELLPRFFSHCFHLASLKLLVDYLVPHTTVSEFGPCFAQLHPSFASKLNLDLRTVRYQIERIIVDLLEIVTIDVLQLIV